jgi:hypothetical protein
MREIERPRSEDCAEKEWNKAGEGDGECEFISILEKYGLYTCFPSFELNMNLQILSKLPCLSKVRYACSVENPLSQV